MSLAHARLLVQTFPKEVHRGSTYSTRHEIHIIRDDGREVSEIAESEQLKLRTGQRVSFLYANDILFRITNHNEGQNYKVVYIDHFRPKNDPFGEDNVRAFNVGLYPMLGLPKYPNYKHPLYYGWNMFITSHMWFWVLWMLLTGAIFMGYWDSFSSYFFTQSAIYLFIPYAEYRFKLRRYIRSNTTYVPYLEDLVATALAAIERVSVECARAPSEAVVA